MTKEQHPLTAKIGTQRKVLVRMPNKSLRWRCPHWRCGGWYVRDSYGWRELTTSITGGFNAGTF